MADERGIGDRGLAPVVGKALEIGIVVVFVGLLASTLYGVVVPEYRATAGERLADRTLAAAAHDVEAVVPAGIGHAANGSGAVPDAPDGLPAGDRNGTAAVNGRAASGSQDVVTLGVDVRDRVVLPDEIRGRAYELRAVDGALVIDHPNPRIEGRQPLAVPGTVADVRGSWDSTDPALVRVRLTDAGTVVELQEGRP